MDRLIKENIKHAQERITRNEAKAAVFLELAEDMKKRALSLLEANKRWEEQIKEWKNG